MTEKPSLLLVDDSPIDRRLFQFAAEQVAWIGEIRACNDGQGALQVLLGHDEAPAWLPELIVLDLNMPCMDGFELLGRIKKLPNLRHIPTIVLTTSSADKDIARSYSLEADRVVTKPSDFPGYIETLKSLREFWRELNALPAHMEAHREP